MTQPDYAAIAREITNYGQARVESILRKHFGDPPVAWLEVNGCPTPEQWHKVNESQKD